MMTAMRHRLFHAIVIAGASMACGGGEESSSTVDSGTADSNAADSNVTDSSDSSVVDSSAPETPPTVDATPDVCDGGCGSSCFPCIK